MQCDSMKDVTQFLVEPVKITRLPQVYTLILHMLTFSKKLDMIEMKNKS